MEATLGELAALLGAELEGDPARVVSHLAPLEDAGARALSFFSNRRYKKAYLATEAGAVLVGNRDRELGKPAGVALLWVDDAYLAFAKASNHFHPQPRPAAGIDPRAVVDPSAELDPTATVMPFCVIGPKVKLGEGVVLHPGCVVLEGATIGEGSVLWPGVVVCAGTVLGARTVVQPGAVIGGDGFGFAFDPDGPGGVRHLKIPQVGRVVVDDDVEIGANTCIDRGTLGDTRVHQGVKIDNLCQIGHNVEVGPLSLLAGCTAIAGSTKLGVGVVCGGQVGIVGHLTIGDGTRFAARAGAAGDTDAGETVSGWPAVPHKRWLREQAALRRLPDAITELRDLKKRLAALEAKLGTGEET